MSKFPRENRFNINGVTVESINRLQQAEKEFTVLKLLRNILYQINGHDVAVTSTHLEDICIIFTIEFQTQKEVGGLQWCLHYLMKTAKERPEFIQIFGRIVSAAVRSLNPAIFKEDDTFLSAAKNLLLSFMQQEREWVIDEPSGINELAFVLLSVHDLFFIARLGRARGWEHNNLFDGFSDFITSVYNLSVSSHQFDVRFYSKLVYKSLLNFDMYFDRSLVVSEIRKNLSRSFRDCVWQVLLQTNKITSALNFTQFRDHLESVSEQKIRWDDWCLYLIRLALFCFDSSDISTFVSFAKKAVNTVSDNQDEKLYLKYAVLDLLMLSATEEDDEIRKKEALVSLIQEFEILENEENVDSALFCVSLNAFRKIAACEVTIRTSVSEVLENFLATRPQLREQVSSESENPFLNEIMHKGLEASVPLRSFEAEGNSLDSSILLYLKTNSACSVELRDVSNFQPIASLYFNLRKRGTNLENVASFDEGPSNRPPDAAESTVKWALENLSNATKEESEIAILGNVGYGKSSLTRKLAYSWSNGEWGPHFLNLFVVQLSRLNASQSSSRFLVDVIVEYGLSGFEPKEPELLRDHVRSRLDSSSTLVIFDDVDDVLHSDILEEAKMWKNKCIFIGRPDTMRRQITAIKVVLRLEELTENQIEKTLASENIFWESIQASDEIKRFMSRPIHLSITIEQFKRNPLIAEGLLRKQSRFHFLEEHINILMRHFSDPQNLETEQNALLDALGDLASQTSHRQGLEIENKEDNFQFLESDLLKTLIGKGLLVRDEHLIVRFPNKMILDFCAGRTLTKCLLSQDPTKVTEALNWIQREKFRPQSCNVFEVAGGAFSKHESPGRVRELLMSIHNGDGVLAKLHREKTKNAVLQQALLSCRSEDEDALFNALNREFQFLERWKKWIRRGIIALRKSKRGENEDDTVMQAVLMQCRAFPVVLKHMPQLLEVVLQELHRNRWKASPSLLEVLAELVHTNSGHFIARLSHEIQLFDQQGRRSIMSAMRVLSVHSQSIVPSLIQILNDLGDDDYVLQWTVVELVRRNPDQLVNSIEKFTFSCKSPNYWIRRSCISTAEIVIQHPQGMEQAHGLFEALVNEIKDAASTMEQTNRRRLNVSVGLIESIGVIIRVAQEHEVKELVALFVQNVKHMDEEIFEAVARCFTEIVIFFPAETSTILHEILSGPRQIQWPGSYPILKSFVKNIGRMNESTVAVLIETLEQCYNAQKKELYWRAIMLHLIINLPTKEQFSPDWTVIIAEDCNSVRADIAELAFQAMHRLIKFDPKNCDGMYTPLMNGLNNSVWKTRLAATTTASDFVLLSQKHFKNIMEVLLNGIVDADDTICKAAAVGVKNAIFANEKDALEIIENLNELYYSPSFRDRRHGIVHCYGLIVEEMSQYIVRVLPVLRDALTVESLSISSEAALAMAKVVEAMKDNLDFTLVHDFERAAQRNERQVKFPAIKVLTKFTAKLDDCLPFLLRALNTRIECLSLQEWAIYFQGIDTALGVSTQRSVALLDRLLAERIEETKEIRDIRKNVIEKRSVRTLIEWYQIGRTDWTLIHIARKVFQSPFIVPIQKGRGRRNPFVYDAEDNRTDLENTHLIKRLPYQIRRKIKIMHSLNVRLLLGNPCMTIFEI